MTELTKEQAQRLDTAGENVIKALREAMLSNITKVVGTTAALHVIPPREILLAAARGLGVPVCVADPGNAEAVPDDHLGLVLPWDKKRPQGCSR